MSQFLIRFTVNFLTLVVIICFSISRAVAQPLPSPEETPEGWYKDGKATLQRALENSNNTRRAKNVILFVGDGMGVSTVTAARIYDGQKQGHSGEENLLSFEKLPHIGLSKTYNTNQQTPDSAGTMTAMMTGVKSRAGVISVDQTAERSNCESSKGTELKTFLEEAEEIGMSTGVVSTATITHATPAATYAHTPNRNWENDSSMPDEAKAAGCADIARQLIEFNYGDGVEVALGGGRANFLPDTSTEENPSSEGRRDDGRNLTQEWLSKYVNSAYVENLSQLNQIDADKTDHLLGLFNRGHMLYDVDRHQPEADEPSLSTMASKALDILQRNRKGFFLMVEAGRIDHGHHAGNAYRALQDARELSNAVQTVLDRVDLKDTLVIVTADHSHTFTIAGYPTRGNPILGKVVSNDRAGNPSTEFSTASDDLPYTTVGYRNGRGFSDGLRERGSGEKTGRHDLTNIDTEDHDFHQEALIPMGAESHAAEDVAIYAGGPFAHLFHQTHEQNYIYHVMRHAARVDRKRGWWFW